MAGMSILEKNEEILKNIHTEFYDKYLEAKHTIQTDCIIEELEDGEKIICRIWEGHEWRLNSAYDPNRAANLYADRYGKWCDFAVLCIFGLSDGKAVRELLKNCNETQSVIIYEPDAGVFLTALEWFPLEDIFCRQGLKLVVEGINGSEMQTVLQNGVTYQNHTLMQCCILPNYDILYTKACERYIERMLHYSKLEVFKKNTEINYAARMADNIMENLPYMIEQSSVCDLERAFSGLDLKEIPAIIVSAGPSLDKNIRELKQAEGKAFIIGVDSSLKALVREGIRFQIAVSVDPRKDPGVFGDERVQNLPYVLDSYSLPMIAETAKKRLFFASGYGFSGFQKLLFSLTGKETGDLNTGGSVATSAFSLAKKLGFGNIILIGQDLAFTGGRGHVSGFEASEEENRKHLEKRTLVEVEANGGGMIATDIQMDSYRQWFEMEIEKAKPTITVYNATEGGAKIHGAIEISLAEAIKKLCSREMDFDRVIAEVPTMFNAEERKMVYQELYSSTKRLEELETRIQGYIGDYEKLIELERSGQQNTSAYRELLQAVYRANHIEETELYLSLAKLYAKNAEYEAAGDIYESTELSVEEILQKGKTLLEGYVEGIHICSKQMEEILLPKLPPLMS